MTRSTNKMINFSIFCDNRLVDVSKSKSRFGARFNDSTDAQISKALFSVCQNEKFDPLDYDRFHCLVR